MIIDVEPFKVTPLEWMMFSLGVVVTVPMLIVFNGLRKQLLKDHRIQRALEEEHARRDRESQAGRSVGTNSEKPV